MFSPPQIPIINDGLLYANGLVLSYVSAKVITMSAGAARDASNTNDISLSALVTIDGSKTGANGFDSGVLGATQCYAVYVVGDSTSYKPTAGLISANLTTMPVLPAGYDMYRRVGWVVTNDTAQILKFYQYGKDEKRTYYYDVDDSFGVVVLSGGAEIEYTQVQMGAPSNAPVVPPIATRVIFRNEYDPALAANTASFQTYGATATAASVTVGLGVALLQLQSFFIDCELDETGVPSIQYKVTASDATSLIVQGYDDYLY